MKKQILSLVVVSTLSLSVLLSPTLVNRASAEDIADLKKQQEGISQERSGLNADIKEKESKIGELKTEQATVESEIKRLDLAVEDATNKLAEKNAQIKETQQEVDQLKAEIAVLIERMEKRNELLKDRAVAFQENGGNVSYIDVLFGARSFSDFVDRVSAVATLVEADKDIFEQHQKDKADLETKQKEVETKLADLQAMKKELEGLKANLDSQVAEKSKLMSSLKHEEEEMHAEMIAAEEEAAVLAAQESAIQQAIQMEQNRMAAEAAELERQQAAAAAAAATTVKQNDGGSSSSTEAPASTEAATQPPASSGAFTWPAAGRVSSGFGGRSLGNHFGVDIAQSGGNVPIVAAANGVVIRSYYSSSYGNAIFVSHSINGQVYTTVYAHMSARAAGSGAVVKKGQRIGTMGNTGQSYGQHLHFEIHKGPWTNSKGNAVNPLSYL